MTTPCRSGPVAGGVGAGGVGAGAGSAGLGVGAVGGVGGAPLAAAARSLSCEELHADSASSETTAWRIVVRMRPRYRKAGRRSPSEAQDLVELRVVRVELRERGGELARVVEVGAAGAVGDAHDR